MSAYTIVDANGDHFGYGRTDDLNTAMADAERLNVDPATMLLLATGDPAHYAAPFRPVRVANLRGRFTELSNR